MVKKKKKQEMKVCNPKERQRQTMFNLAPKCIHLIHSQSKAHNSPIRLQEYLKFVVIIFKWLKKKKNK